LRRHARPATRAEQVFDVAAVAADVHAHVLHHTQHRHVHLLEHLEPLARVGQGNVLRCGDDDGAGNGNTLRQCELDVTRARGHVDDQVVEVTPIGIPEQLRQCLSHHRAAPDHGLLGIDQKTDGHGHQAMRRQRLDAFAVGRGRPLAREAQHDGLAGPVDVGVEDADPGALVRPGKRQVCGDCGLADAALARCHGYDVAYTRQWRQRPLHGVCGDPGNELDVDVPRPAAGRYMRRELA
jgi:hypothetical protein